MKLYKLTLKNQDHGLKPIQEIILTLFFAFWLIVFIIVSLTLDYAGKTENTTTYIANKG